MEPTNPNTGDSRAIDILQAEVQRLQAINASLTSERDKLQSAIESIGAERDELADQVGTPDEYRQQLEELRGQIRTRNHRDVFDRVALDQKAHKKALDALWRLSGYEADSDTVDEGRIAGIVGRLREEADYAFEAPTSATPATAPTPGRGGIFSREQPVPAAGRGGPIPAVEGSGLTREQLADPTFVLNPANKSYIRERIKAAQEARARGAMTA